MQGDDIADVYAENIPEVLKDHDRWLLWDASNDTPRRPHWKGDFSVSYNDPDAWQTFEEALEAAESNPSWGIGIVTTDTPVTVIDLDGCRRTDGHFSDEMMQWQWWVPDEFIDDITENYKEFSPSKTGVHLPVIGFDVPGWWNDTSFDDAEHEGVDVLDNKFCTMTGMGGGDLPVVDVADGDDQWLRGALADLYETITGEDPRAGPDTPDSGYSPGDEWLQPADVQAALSHIDPDVGYPQWRTIGFAVAEYFRRVDGDLDDDAFDVALETFEDWSQDGEKWDREAEQNAFNIIKAGFEDGAENESNVTIGTLLHVAERNGWEMPDKDARLAVKAVDEFIDNEPPVDERDDDRDGPKADALKELVRAVPGLSEEDYEARVDDIVPRIASSRERIDRHRDLAADHEYGDLVNENGQLMRVTRNTNGWMFTKPVLSFEFDVDSILNLPDDEGRSSIVRIDPPAESEPEFELDVPPETFNDVRTFKQRVLSKVYSTTIEDDRSQADVMDSIRHWIAEQDVPVRDAQYEIGLNADGTEFVTPAGSIVGDGWTDDPDAVHIERGNQTNATVRQFSADPDEHDDIHTDEVAEMIELLAKSRTTERITPLMAWFYAAPHRPRIFDVTATFNPMAVTGRSGSGKTATLAALNQMWGMGTEPQSAEASKHAMLTGFASSKGVPVWFDEYRPEKMPGYVVDRFHSFYKKSATGGVEPRGNTSMGTDDWHLRSPVVVSGESEIRSNAERRRTVNVTVTKKPTQDGPEKQAFKNLVGDVTTDDDGTVQFPDANYDLQQHAVAYYSWVASMGEDEFRGAWFDAREKVAELLNKWGDAVDLGDTEIQALQTVVFGHHQMLAFANAMGTDLSELPGEDALEDALAHVADVDGDGRQPHEHQFFSLVSRAAAADYLEANTDYRVVHEGQPNEELRVNVTRAFDKVSKFARDHDLNEDLLNSAADYKGRFEQLEAEDTFVTTTRQPTQGIARCTGIDMDAAVDEIAGFTRGSFVDVDDADEDDETVNDGDDPDATPIGGLDPEDDGTGYETVTVTVTNWETPTDSEITARGTVKDTTGAVQVVYFGTASADGIEEGDTYRLTNAKVDEWNDDTQLQIEPGTTEIQSIQQGVGWTASEDPGEGQAAMDDVPDGAESQQKSVLTDGGDSDGDGEPLIDPEFVDGDDENVDVRKHVIEVVQGLDDGTSEEDVIEILKHDSPIHPSGCRQAVERLKHAGRLYETGDGLKAVSGGE